MHTHLHSSRKTLAPGSRIAVLGGGPAGSFFANFVLDLAKRSDMDLHVDIFERRDFHAIGPSGCNMCGGIISESLVQALAMDGINLPPAVVERGIDSYVLHMDEGKVRIGMDSDEKRIASVHRGGGPRGEGVIRWESFDAYLLDQARARGAHLVRGRVEHVSYSDGKPRLGVKGSAEETYDLLVVAAGVNTSILKSLEGPQARFRQPRTTPTYIAEFYAGKEFVDRYLGTAMHVFLVNIPRLKFAAIIPKGDFISFCLIGHRIDDQLFQTFLTHKSVRGCFPTDWVPPPASCHCCPRMYVGSASRLFWDRVVCIGDSGVSRLYKDGIGAAYRTAKAAAATAVLNGVSAADFRKHYAPACRQLQTDNMLGRLVFLVTSEIQRRSFHRRGVLRMVAREQGRPGPRRMSTVLWDTFTGSASYSEILGGTLHPAFLLRLVTDIAGAMIRGNRSAGLKGVAPSGAPASTRT